MKTNILNLRNDFLILITGIFIASCSKEETNINVTDNIIGTWTAEPLSVTAMAGTLTMTQYYKGTGLSAEDAQLYADIFENGFLDSYKGTMQINSDHTCISDLLNATFTGKWSLSPDRTKLTMQFPNSVYDPTTVKVTYYVIELTSSKLHLHMPANAYLYNEKNDTADAINIEADVNFTKL